MILSIYRRLALMLAVVFALGTQVSMAQDGEGEFVLDSTQLAAMMQYQIWMDSVNSQFTYDSGTITIGDDLATLIVPEGFKYLDPKQSQVVLEEVWGNPPSEEGLGMLFPSQYGPGSYDGWAINISFEAEGYIDDEDALEIDYTELLGQMKEETAESSKQRVEMGYEPIELIGWAENPRYDGSTHKLFWAKEIRFGEMVDPETPNTLNYNIRILGRKGVLVLNAIATMDELPEVQSNLDAVLTSVNFNKGHRYEEFDPEIDKVAAYGIGGLIAGKVLAKAGILGVLAKFGKFIFFGLVAAAGALKKFVFGKKS